MRESTKRKLLGNKMYPIYRKLKFLRYKKKVLKKRRKQTEYELKQGQLEVKKTIRDVGREDRKTDKKRSRIIRSKEKQQQRELKRKLKELNKKERTENKRKALLQKQEAKREKQEIRKILKEKDSKDEILEKKKSRQSKLSKKQEKRRRKKLTRYIVKRRYRKFLHELKTFDRHSLKRLFNWVLKIAENKDQRNNFLIISLNSLAFFLFSYMIIYIVAQLITVWIALSFDYKTILFYYKIYYNIDSGDWTADSVKILFSIMPIAGLIFGTASIIIYSIVKNESGLIKLFFLWGFIHGMVMFFGSLLVGTLLNKGFGWVIAYMYYRDTGKMVFSILSIFSLITIGIATAKSFLISGNTYFNFIVRKNRRFLLMSQVLLPGIFGSLILMSLKIPNSFYFGTSDEAFFEVMILATIFIVLIPIITTFRSYNEIYFDEEPRKIKLRWVYLIIIIILILAFRHFLSDGVQFEPRSP